VASIARVTTYTLRKGSPDKTRADLVVIGVVQRGSGEKATPAPCEGSEPVASAYGRKFVPLLTSMGFKAGHGETLRLPSDGSVRAGQVLVVGLGPEVELTAEQVRRAAGVAARNVGNNATVALALPASTPELVRAVADGFLSGLYSYTGARSNAATSRVAEVAILSDAARKSGMAEALRTAELLGELTSLSRTWVNTPPNELTPPAFADAVAALSKERKNGVKAEVLDVAALQKRGCGGILGVGMGSVNEPRLVKLTWAPRKARGHVALVGKGVTYDSGGLTIKPGASMKTMKSDMAGAAAVAAAVHAVAELDLPIAVTGWLPMAENMISGRAMRPGDVLTIYGGTTVEITNTDAEGRLLLADALAMAAEEKPDVVLDIATLTAPCVIALGEKIAGVFGDDPTVAAVQAAAEATGELVWRLPLPDHIRESVRTESKVADVLQSNWVRWGSASYAASFLECFTGGLPWAHLDVAGPAYNSGAAWGHVPTGATGFGISTLVEFVARWAG
jgi:leucyl aminopeptidase